MTIFREDAQANRAVWLDQRKLRFVTTGQTADANRGVAAGSASLSARLVFLLEARMSKKWLRSTQSARKLVCPVTNANWNAR